MPTEEQVNEDRKRFQDFVLKYEFPVWLIGFFWSGWMIIIFSVYQVPFFFRLTLAVNVIIFGCLATKANMIDKRATMTIRQKIGFLLVNFLTLISIIAILGFSAEITKGLNDYDILILILGTMFYMLYDLCILTFAIKSLKTS